MSSSVSVNVGNDRPKLTTSISIMTPISKRPAAVIVDNLRCKPDGPSLPVLSYRGKVGDPSNALIRTSALSLPLEVKAEAKSTRIGFSPRHLTTPRHMSTPRLVRLSSAELMPDITGGSGAMNRGAMKQDLNKRPDYVVEKDALIRFRAGEDVSSSDEDERFLEELHDRDNDKENPFLKHMVEMSIIEKEAMAKAASAKRKALLVETEAAVDSVSRAEVIHGITMWEDEIMWNADDEYSSDGGGSGLSDGEDYGDDMMFVPGKLRPALSHDWNVFYRKTLHWSAIICV